MCNPLAQLKIIEKMNHTLDELSDSEMHTNECALEELDQADQGFKKDDMSSTKQFIRTSQKRIKKLIDPLPPPLTDYPELTSQHILNAFMDSGVTYQLAHQLGIILALSEDTIQMIERQNTGGPALFAMEIVNTWLKKDPKESTKETFLTLEENLRQVHLNNVIGKMRRNSQAVVSKLTAVVGKVTQNITRDEAMVFGERLGLSRNVINEVIEEQQPAFRGPFIALALYKEAERRNTFLSHTFVERVTNGLTDVCNTTGMDDDEKYKIKERFRTIKRDSLRHQASMWRSEFGAKQLTSKHVVNVGEHRGRIVFQPHESTEDRVHSGSPSSPSNEKLSIKNKKFILKGSIGLGVFLFFILLVALVIPISLLYPKMEEFPRVTLAVNDTILYPLQFDTFYLRSLEFELLGNFRKTCLAEVLSISCDDISEFTAHDDEQVQFTPDYLYLLKGISITFSTSSEAYQPYSTCSPTYIWIFNDFHMAEMNAENHFEDLACSNPPDGILCVKLNSTVLSTTTPTLLQSSYYFIRCSNHPSCGFLSNIIIHNYAEYDFESSKKNSIGHTDISTRPNGKGSITIQSNPWYPQSSPICILARLLETDGEADEYQIQATHNNYKRNPTIAYHTSIVCSFSFIVLIVLLIIWVSFLRIRGRLRNDTLRPRPLQLENAS